MTREDPPRDFGPCPTCDGRGWIACPRCNGTGYYGTWPCPKCWEGEAACPFCEGPETVEVPLEGEA